ncbi:MAG: hypothetical protein KF865_08945 [Bdellovibrionaceae bacterium]|nr:hypothetical protein [Pseudobdellovibrionaceae bacterium]
MPNFPRLIVVMLILGAIYWLWPSGSSHEARLPASANTAASSTSVPVAAPASEPAPLAKPEAAKNSAPKPDHSVPVVSAPVPALRNTAKPPREEIPAAPVMAAAPEEEKTPSPIETRVDAARPAARRGITLWLGADLVTQNLEQRVFNGPTSSYDSKQKIGFSLQAEGEGEGLGWSVLFARAPGAVLSSDTVRVLDGDYSWDVLRAEVRLPLRSDSWSFLAGLQDTRLPFLDPDTATGVITRTQIQSLDATLGLAWKTPLSGKLSAEAQGRLQAPLGQTKSPGGRVELATRGVAEVTGDLIYAPGENLRLGLRLGLQHHSYQFTYQNDQTNNQISGTQQTRNTSVGLRLGWEY